MKKSLLYLFTFAAVQFFASWALYSVWLLVKGYSPEEVLMMFAGKAALPTDATMMILASAIYSAATLGIFLWRRWSVVSPAYLRSRPWGVFFWTVTAAVGTIIPSVWLQEQLPPLPDTMKDTFAILMGNDLGYFTICIFAPIVEETVFRGAILRTLLGTFRQHWYAIAVSALIFAAIHLNAAQMPHAFLIGLLLGWTYYRTGSILPGILFHWVNNTAAFAVARIFPESDDMWLIDLLGGDHRRVVLSLIFSLFILLPSLYQLNLRMKR